MAKLWLIAAAWLALATVAPALRPLLVVGAFCFMAGLMVGTQHTARHTAELHANRAERAAMRTVAQ